MNKIRRKRKMRLATIKNELKGLHDRILENVIEFENRTGIDGADVSLILHRVYEKIEDKGNKKGKLHLAMSMTVRPNKEYT